MLNVDKNSYPATGITAQLHKQFGVTFPDNTTGFGQSVSDFAKRGEVYINGAKYSLKNFKTGFPQDRKDRVWLDSEGNEVKNKTLIGTLNRLGYSKEDFEKNTETFGALDYGTLAHRTSEMLNILGISEKNLKDAKVKDWKGFKDYIENEISRLEQSSNDKDKALGKEARDKWTQGFDDKGYGGSWNDYIKRYNEGLKLIGLNEKEREAKLNEKVMIGRNYHNLVTFGGNPNYTVLSETAVGIPSGAQRHVSDIDALVQNEATGDTYISDYKTKSGKIKDYELAQILKYQFGIQSLASAAYKNADLQAALKDVDTFKNSTFYNDLGFNDNRPITQEMLEVVKTIVSKAGEQFESKFGRVGSDKEVRDFIYSMVKARLIRGDEKSGESFYLSDAISANKIADPRLASIVEAILTDKEISTDDKAYFYKNAFVKGYGLYDRWGDETSSTTATGKGGRGSKKADAEAQKEYNTLISEELNLKKQLIDAEIELQKLKNVEGKTAENQDVKDKEAEIDFLKDELDYNQKRKKKLIKDGAKEDAAKTAADDEKLSYYARMRGYDIKNTSVGGIEGGVKNIDNLTPEEQADYWSQYERALDKQARAEEEIFGIRNKAAVSYGTEKNLLYQIADEKAKGLATSQAELDNLEKIVKGLGKEAQTRVKSLKEQVALNQQLYKLQALKQTRGATSIWDVMANDIRRATMRIADFGIAAKLLNKIPQDIQKVIQYTKELDAAMTNIRVVTGASAEEAQTLARGYTQLAKELGVTTVEVANSANEWARQGYEAEEANKLIVASSKLAKLGMISTTEATKDLTSAIKGFKLSTEEAMSVVDKLTKIDQVAAISAGNLAEGLARVATTAQQAGLSLDETAAMVTTITEVTQRDASTAGEALRTLISRYSNVKAGVFTSMGEEAEETSGNINDIEKVLGKLGIRIRTSGTEMRSIEDVLDELAEKWDTLDDVSRNAVASAFAGVRQRESFNILLSNWDRVKELTEESANAAGTADEKYTAYMDSMEAATKRLQNAWEGFTQSLETSTVMKFLTNTTALLVENTDKLKYIVTGIAAASSLKIFDFFTNKGETGGWKGLVANIPFIGRGTKTNNILESIDKKVGNIEKGVGADSLANQTKNGGLFKRIGGFLKTGFGRGDIYDPETGKSISYKDLKLAKKLGINAQNSVEYAKYAKLLKERKIGNAAMGAVSAVLTNLFTTKQVGGDVGGFIAKNIVGMGDNKQTIEETESDKLRRTLYSGGAAALGGALFGPLGAMFGQTIGEGVASIVSTIGHRSELEMKQQVADAKSRDKQLTNIKESVDSVSLDLGDKTENYETYQKRKKEVDVLRDKIDSSDDAVRASINVAAKSKGYSGGYDEMLNSLLDTNLSSSQRENIKNDLLYIISSEKAKNYRNTQLIELEKLNKAKAAAENQYDGGFEWLENVGLWDSGNIATLFTSGAFQEALQKAKDLGYITKESFAKAAPLFGDNSWDIRAVGATADERIANYAKFRDILKEIGEIGYFDVGDYQFGDVLNALVSFGGKNRLLQNMISSLDAMIANYNQGPKLQSEWQSNFALAGLYGSGLSLMKPSKLQELGLEGAIQEIADFLENNFSEVGLVVRDETGKIIESVHDDIKKAIKDDEILYNNLIFPQTSIKEWQQNSGKLLNIIEKLGIKTEDELAAAAEKGGKEFSDLAKSVGLTTTELRSLLNLGSEDYLSEMAKSINLTKEQLLGFAKSVKGLDRVALSAFTLSSSQLTEKFDLMREAYFAAIDGSWAGDSEILNKINSDNFIKGFITNINNAEQTAKELGEILYSSGQSLEEFLQGFALFSDVITSGSQIEGFINYLKETDPALKAVVVDMNNIKEILDYIANNPETTGDLRSALEQYIQLQEVQKYNEALDKSMQAVVKSNEKQIENLTQQKEALGSINDERKKELEYIKAKDALENARKEKKRVYRAGVGWAYESDDNAIAEASEKIQSLDVEKQQNLLQIQIDALEQQNTILENLPNEKELEELKQVLKDLTGSMTINSEVVSTLVDMYNNPNYKFNAKDYIDNYLKNWKPNAVGNISFSGGGALINELGTEAVITPGGTLTALPSKTGIVPADITRNVWALGEVAPTLVAQLGSLTQKMPSGNAGNTTYEEGQYFDNFTMNVYPAKGDDFNKILEQARAQMRLTRHNN